MKSNTTASGFHFTMHLWMFSGIICLLLGSFGISSGAGMSGAYTIDKNSSATNNFKSFKAAVTALTTSGVAGAVVFNVANDVYTEQVLIGSISGADMVNNITFQSASGDSSKVVLGFASSTTSASNYTLYLKACSYVNFSKMTIQRTGTSAYGTVVQMDGGSYSNSFRHCIIKGIKLTSTTGTSDQSIIYSATTTDDSNKFVSNSFKYGAYQFYLTGMFYVHENCNTIQDNLLDSASMYGIYATYADSFYIHHNRITNILSSTGAGIFLKYYYRSSIRGNTIYMPNGGSGIYADYTHLYTSYDSTFIANNMITMGGTASMGIYVYYVQAGFVNFYNNSILLTSTNGATSTAMWLDQQNSINVRNNIFINKGTGYAYYIHNHGRVNFHQDFNDLYTKGTYLGNFTGTLVKSLPQWIAVTEYDSNGLNVDAPYVSNTDLHLSSESLRNGLALGSVTDDFDGYNRAILPTLGADERIPYALDARITAIDTPGASFCSGSRGIVVTLTNIGTTALTSASISWAVNGGTPSTYSWAGTLAFGASAHVSIGTFTFNPGTTYKLAVYSSSPNGGTDANPANDTLVRTNFATSLNGAYTIGGSGADYASFTAATTDLNNRGVCGPVTFNVANGSYNEQIEINVVSGASSINTITFQSASGDSSKVVLYYAPSATNNYVVHLNGGRYITFNRITIKNTATKFGIVARIDGGAHYNTFTHNRLIGINTSSDSTYQSIIYSTNNTVHGNAFVQNLFKYGSQDIYMYASFGTYNFHTVIQDNVMDSAYFYGIRLEYQDSLIITGNKITNVKNAGYGIYIHAFGKTLVTKNTINMAKGGTGIYLTYPFLPLSKGDSSYITNNMLSIAGTYSTGMFIDGGYLQYVNFYYNSVLLQKTNGNYSFVFYIKSFNSTPHVRLLNNIFDNEGTGYCIYFNYSNLGISTSDYNDLYTRGTNLGFINNTNFTTIGNWRSTSGWDSKSMNVAAPFVSSANLHLKNPAGLGSGTMLGNVLEDFDGDVRSSLPYIGADEIPASGYDIGISAIDTPGSSVCSGPQNIVATLTNFGKLTVSKATIKWQVNGGPTYTYAWTGTLAPGAKTSVNAGSYTFLKGFTYNLIVYSSAPNGGVDSLTSNDTASRSNFVVALNGTYKIGGPGKDFNNFTQAITYLHKYGVCGSVVFNVQDSTYKEQIEINLINGASAINTITFQSKSGDSSKVKLSYPSGSGLNYTVYMNTACYIIFNKITILRSGTGYSNDATVIKFYGGAHHNTFSHNKIIGINSTYGNTNQSVVYSVNSRNDSNCFIQNLFKYGSYTFYWYGTSTGYALHTVIKDNILDSFNSYGIYTFYQDSISIVNNRLNNNANQYAYGMSLNYYGRSNILKNNITMLKGGYGIYSGFVGIPNMGTDSTFFTNNMISMGGADAVGMYIYTPSYQLLKLYYNTILMQSSNGNNSYAIQMEIYKNDSFIDLINNIFDNRGTGYALHVKWKGYGPHICDYNNLYTKGASLAYIDGTAYSSMATWRAATPFDLHSLNQDPVFVSATNLHLNASGLKNAMPVSNTNEDIDGQIRSASTPNIGADEYTYARDLGVAAILSPGSGCGDTKAIVKVLVKNYGSASQSSFPIYFSLNGGTPVSATYPRVLAAGGADTFTFPVRVNTYIAGILKMKAYTGLSTDQDPNNDSASASIIIDIPNAGFSSRILDYAAKKVRFEPVDSTGSLRYNWNFGDGSSNDTMSVHPTHNYPSNIGYLATLTVKSARGCISTATDSVNLIMTGLKSVEDNGFAVQIYPNPFTDNTNIHYKLEKPATVQILVYDVYGKIVSRVAENARQAQGNYTLGFDATHLSAGLYFVRMKVDNEVMEKMIVRVR